MRGGEIFVPPDLRTERIGDLALAVAIANKTTVEIVGRRPGEKLHECLISPDEPDVVDAGWAYVVQPAEPSWSYQRWEGDPFVGAYTSDYGGMGLAWTA
jgi:FlaA1/EpsC-like NDP-sugar epimerase